MFLLYLILDSFDLNKKASPIKFTCFCKSNRLTPKLEVVKFKFSNTYALLVPLLLIGLLRAQTPVSFTIQNTSISNSITCNNPSVKLIASSSHSDVVNYFWTGPAGFSFSGSFVIITSPGVYTVTASSTNVANTTQLISIGINTTVPSCFVNPTYTSMSCNALSIPQITTSCNLSSNVTHYYMAPYGGTFVASVPTSTYKPAGPGTYTHVLIDGMNGCEAVNTFTIGSTSGIPTFDLSCGQNFTLGCGSKSVTIIQISNASTFPAGGALSYTLVGPTTSSMISPGTLSNATSYSVNVAGAWTAVVRDNVTLCESRVPVSVIQNTLVPIPTVIVPNQILNCTVARTRLQAISPSQFISFSWTSSNGLSNSGDTLCVTSQTNSPYNIHLDSYTLTCKDDNNLCTSDTVISIYQNIFTPSAIISAGASPAVLTCTHPTLVLTNSATTGIPSWTGFNTNLPVVAHLWKGPQPLSPASYTATYLASTSGFYTLAVTDQNNGCKAHTSIPVFDGKNYPVVNYPNGPVPFCINPTLSIVSIYANVSGNAGAYSYQWTGPAGSIVNYATSYAASANALGIYSVVVTNTASGCSTLGQVIVSSCITGLQKKTTENTSINISPNPSSNYYKIDSDQELNTLKIKIYNSLGALIQEGEMPENHILDLSKHPAGIYVLSLQSDNALVHISRLIKE